MWKYDECWFPPSSNVPATVYPRVGNWSLTNSRLVSSSIISKNIPYPISLNHLYSGHGEDNGEFWMVCAYLDLHASVRVDTMLSLRNISICYGCGRTPYNGRHRGWQSTVNLICRAHGERSNSDLGNVKVYHNRLLPREDAVEGRNRDICGNITSGCVGPSVYPPTHASLR